MIREAIAKVVAGEDLTRDESVAVMNEIMSGETTDAQIGAFLVGLRLKGETVDEIAGAAQVMREKAIHVPTRHEMVVDTCGTGGDRAGTFNISTTSAFVVAGAGVCVAKHGNRSVSSRCGSADVLKALGVNIDLPPEKVGQCLDEVGIGFLFAPALHWAMKYAIGPRREMGVRTIFNVLGPLTNPAGAKRQLIGVYDRALTQTLAEVLRDLGSDRGLIVHGSDGLDEITVTGESTLSFLIAGDVWNSTVSPSRHGIPLADPADLLGGTPEENAEITLNILKGEKGPQRDIVVMNAGAGIWVSKIANDLAEGITMAQDIIDSGKALQKLQDLKEASHS